MRFPLNARQLTRGCVGHVQAGLGCGADYRAGVGTPLYAPANGVVQRTYYGHDGGNWLWLTVGDTSIQFAHLSQYKVKQGQSVREGDLLALTGNSGAITTGPHLHIQCIRNGKRIDPEQYFTSNNQGGDDVTNEQAKLLIYKATQGHEPQGAERDFALGPISPSDLADLRFKDDVVGTAWIASNGDYCPQSEKDYWFRAQREHGGHPVETFGRTWYQDHVVPKIKNDPKLTKAKDIITKAAISINEL